MQSSYYLKEPGRIVMDGEVVRVPMPMRDSDAVAEVERLRARVAELEAALAGRRAAEAAVANVAPKDDINTAQGRAAARQRDAWKLENLPPSPWGRK